MNEHDTRTIRTFKIIEMLIYQNIKIYNIIVKILSFITAYAMEKNELKVQKNRRM